MPGDSDKPWLHGKTVRGPDLNPRQQRQPHSPETRAKMRQARIDTLRARDPEKYAPKPAPLMGGLSPGMIVRFTYNHPPEAIDANTGDKSKEVFILHPSWQGQVHGIDLKRLTMAERAVLSAILDPRVHELQKRRPHHVPLVNDVLRRMNPIEEIKNPQTFYVRFVKVFLRNKDAYRKYDRPRMLQLTVVKKTSVTGKVINPKPLFHKVESKPHPTSASAFARHPDTPEEKARQARMAKAKADRIEREKKRAEQQGRVKKPSIVRPPRNK